MSCDRLAIANLLHDIFVFGGEVIATDKARTTSSGTSSQTGTSTTTNTPGWANVPQTDQEKKLEGMVGQTDFSTPIRNQYARAQQDLSRSYNNPLGGYTTADVRDKASRQQSMGLGQSEAAALGNAAQQNQQAAFGQQATVAGLMAPQFYNAGSTSNSSQTGTSSGTNAAQMTGGDWLSTGLGTAQGIASMF